MVHHDRPLRVEDARSPLLLSAATSRQSEERFRSALKAAPVIVSSQDLALRYTWIHDPAEWWLPVEVIGRRDVDLMDAADAEVLTTIKRLAIDNGTGARQEVRVRRGDVEAFYDLTVEPLRDTRGATLGVACAAIDITRHRLLEAKLRQQWRQAVENDKRKDEFLAVLGHELRNPLAPIANGIRILDLGETSPQLRQKTLGVMRRQVGQMVRLLDDLLDVSRISRGKMQLRRQPLLLADIVAAAVDTCTPLIEYRRHELRVHLPAEPLRLWADSDRMTQVFANLLHNAAKYTDEGGRILLTATRDGPDAIVYVRDTGIGISADLLPGVFELFRQGEASQGRARGGLGLGLTVVRRLVEMHGGSVAVTSDGPGRGSEFAVRLPLIDDAATSGAPDRRSP